MLFRDGDVWSVWNSLVIASISTLIAMVFGTLCAYSIVRFRTGGENLAVWILSQRMLPPIAVVFPIFLLYVKVGWADTYHGLILLYTAFALPYVIWMMRGYLQEIPVELEESALVDGCSRWAVLRHVVIPVARSGLLATAVFAFIFSWNEFLFALVLTRTQVLTYPVQISQYFGSQSTFWAKISAMSVLGTLPVFFAGRGIPTLSGARHLARCGERLMFPGAHHDRARSSCSAPTSRCPSETGGRRSRDRDP